MPVNSDPHYQIPTPTLERTMPQRREKRAVPKRFKSSTAPKPTTTCPPIPEAPPKPKTDVPESRPPPLVPVLQSTSCHGTGRASGNLFEDRNWLLPPNYLDSENKIIMNIRMQPVSIALGPQ